MDNEFIEISGKVDKIREMMEKETHKFLDNMDTYTPPRFEINFCGESIQIPIDFAEINNSIQYFLEDLAEALNEY